MRDKTRLMLTGAVALTAAALTVSGNGLSLTIGDDDGPRTVRTLANLKGFDGIALVGADHVVVTQARNFSVRTEGDPEALARLRLYVSGGMLHVERARSISWFGSGKAATIRVALPRLSHVELVGSGDMTVARLDGPSVKASLTGSGDLSISDMTADQVELAMSGSGDLSAAGHAKAVTLSQTGSGDLRAGRLDAGSASIKLVGSGDVYALVHGKANVSILGSGDAHVAGTKECAVSKLGSGEAHCST